METLFHIDEKSGYINRQFCRLAEPFRVNRKAVEVQNAAAQKRIVFGEGIHGNLCFPE